jgi:hypothetical protein
MTGKTYGRSAKSATPKRRRILFAQRPLVRDPDSNAAECRQLGERVSMSFELLLETIHSKTTDSSKAGNEDALKRSSARLSLRNPFPSLYADRESAPVAVRAG